MSTTPQVPIADAPKEEAVDVEAANTQPEQRLPDAQAVRTGTASNAPIRADAPIRAQPAPVRSGPKAGDRIVMLGDDRIEAFQPGWCLLPWFSFLCCFVPVVSVHRVHQQPH
jgi:hypothetical protein